MRVTFLGSGKYSDVFFVSDGRHKVVMKLSYYRDATICNMLDRLKKKTTKKVRDSISVSAAFGKITNAMISSKISPHFVTMYCEVDCPDVFAKLAPILQDRLATNASKYQLKYNHVCFMEVFTSDMTKWVRKNPSDADLKAAVFQVLYTLAALQTRFRSFRHNDLSTNNILVKVLPQKSPFVAQYTLPNGTSYGVNTRVFAALNDYDFTHIQEVPALQNERVLSQKYKVSNAHNPTYDTHFFLKSLWKTTSSHELRKFLKGLPLKEQDRLEEYKVEGDPGSGVAGAVVPGLEPLALLKLPYFDSLKTQQPTAAAARYSF